MEIAYPVYDNSILAITNSILKYYGAKPHHNTLPFLDNLLQKNYRNVVLLVFDGLGMNVLERNLPETAFLRRKIKTEVTSVFPPTTAAAITTIMSGKTPNEHGWIGWSCYFNEIDKCVDLFSGNQSGIAEGIPACSEHISNKLLGFEDIFSQIHKATNGEVGTYSVSPFSEHFVDTCQDVCVHLERLCRDRNRKFIYGYHYQPDHDMHDFGVSADCIREMIENFNQQIEALANTLNDTLLLITADHGMTDIIMKCIEDYPQIQACLKRQICMEPRCCSFYVRDEYKEEFHKLFDKEFGDKFILYDHNDFIRSKLLGGGLSHAKVNEFVGDYVAVAVSDYGLWYKDNKGEYKDFKGCHAGLVKDEMLVPLIVIERAVSGS